MMKLKHSLITSLFAIAFSFIYNPVSGQSKNTSTLCSPATSIDTVSACYYYNWINGKTYTASNNTDKDTLFNAAANGCDSIVQLNLTITGARPTIKTNAFSITPDTFKICQGEFATFENSDTATPGLNDTTFWELAGAISNPGNVRKIASTQFNNPGFYEFILIKTNDQCGYSPHDTVYLHVVESHSAYGSGDQAICQNESATLTIHNFNQGLLRGNSRSQDSIIWNLPVQKSNITDSTYSVTVSPTDTTLYSATIYKTIKSSNGIILTCPTQIDFNVTLNPIPVVQLTKNDIACNADGTVTATAQNQPLTLYDFAWSNGHTTLNTTTSTLTNIDAGLYKVTVTEQSTSCSSIDSIEVLNSATAPTNQIQSLIANCTGSTGGSVSITTSGGFPPYSFSWNDGPSTATSRDSLPNGNYTITVLDGFGCSTSLSFSISDQTISNQVNNITACKNTTYTYPDNSSELITGNTSYISTLTGAAGCDSIITTNITMTSANVNTNTVGATVSSLATNASYQWLDCDNNYSVINNETNQSFASSSNGNYAVEVTENSCIDTSSCVPILTVGISENTFKQNFKLFPNPTHGQVSIQFENPNETLTVKLFSIAGLLIKSEVFNNSTIVELDIHEPSGVYFIELTNNLGEQSLVKVVKK